MEIELELESGFVCDFEPDFDLPGNSCFIEEVQWNFHNGSHTGTVASLLYGTSEHEYATTHISETL
jgi:hypothetical protein